MLNLRDIDREAEKLLQKIHSGELAEGCCMSAVQTPSMEAWETAQDLADNSTLSSTNKRDLLSKLDKNIQSQLAATDCDDFALQTRSGIGIYSP